MGNFINRQILSGSGDYVPTSGTVSILVKMVGGGAGGAGAPGGTALAAGSGGSSGLYFEKYFNTISATGSYSVGVPGAGGVGGQFGLAGSGTFFSMNDVTHLAPGGNPGSWMSNFNSCRTSTPTAPSGAVGNPDFSTYGAGLAGFRVVSGSFASNGFALGGNGGSNPLGGGGLGGVVDHGTDGTGYGAGGGGAATTSVSKHGGSGSIGVIIVDEFA